VLCGLAQGYGTPCTTVLSAPIDSVATTIPVVSTAGFAYSDYIWIDSERMAYAGTDSTDFLNVTRGTADNNGLGGTATAHDTGSYIYSENMNALNSMLSLNYSSLSLTYGAPIAFSWSAIAYISSIPRFVFWNVGFMQGNGWSMIKVIVLYPLSAAFVIAFIFYLFQIIWMLKPNIL
jgi:hypothetical protein